MRGGKGPRCAAAASAVDRSEPTLTRRERFAPTLLEWLSLLLYCCGWLSVIAAAIVLGTRSHPTAHQMARVVCLGIGGLLLLWLLGDMVGNAADHHGHSKDGGSDEKANGREQESA